MSKQAIRAQLLQFGFASDLPERQLFRTTRPSLGKIRRNKTFAEHAAPFSDPNYAKQDEAFIDCAVPGTNPDEDFSYVVAMIFLAFAKMGGSEASFLVARKSPHVIQSPYMSDEDKKHKQFLTVVSDIQREVVTPQEDTTELRQLLVACLEQASMEKQSSPEPLIGNIAVVAQDVFEKLGSSALIHAFEIVFVVQDTTSNVADISGDIDGDGDALTKPAVCARITMWFNGAIYLGQSASDWMQLVRNVCRSVTKLLRMDSLSLQSGERPTAAAAAINNHRNSSSTSSASLAKNHQNSSFSFMSNKTTCYRDVDVFDPEMLYRMNVQWQPTSMPEAIYTTTTPRIFDRVVHTGMTHPASHVAVIEPRTKRQVTYEELQTSSIQFASYVTNVTITHPNVRKRFGEDATIALFLPRCADWYILMLGCHRAGAAYLSLDPDFPPERIQMILEDSEPLVLVTRSDMKDLLEKFEFPDSVKVMYIDEEWRHINKHDASEFESPTHPHTPAYLIYTSGSTGRPKGVCIEHINVAAFVLSEVKLFALTNRHRVIQGFSTSFDASVEEIWLGFASGSALVVVEKSTMQDADALCALIQRYQVTVFSTVPSLLAMMDAQRVPQLELVISGAEALGKEVVDAWAPAADDTETKRRFVNSYGPTEATVACCCDNTHQGKTVTIGRAQPNYVAYIVDENMKLVPPGVPGELCMAGPGVARGYVGRDDLTAEKFIHCPFHQTFTRMYRTGDLVRWNTVGKLVYLGRIDAQVKLRGFRIETGEIETQLATLPQVTTAVVVLRDDGDGPYLCAYMVMASPEEAKPPKFKESVFRKHLSATLPKYMIPARFASVAHMPRTPAGKLNRKGFPPPPPPVAEVADDGSDDGGEGGAAVPPTTENERLLFDLWKTLVPSVKGITDNFFEIGGHSLLAGKLSSGVRKAGFENCSIQYVFNFPTIEQLGAALGEREHRSLPKVELPPLEKPHPVTRVCFLFTQLVTIYIIFLMLPAYVFTLLSLYGYTSDFENVVARATISDTSSWDVGGFILASLVIGALMAGGSFVHMFIILPLLKWTLLQRVEEGSHSIWSFFFIRWWIVRAVGGIVPLWFLQGTVFLTWFLRVMGATIGDGVVYCAPTVADPDLIEIDDDCYIGNESALVTSQIVDSMLILRKVKIGKTTTIGTRCVVEGGAVIGSECIISHLSLVRGDEVIPDGQRWGGSPAVVTNAVTTPSLEVVAGLAGIDLPELGEGEDYPASLRPGFGLQLFVSTMYLVVYVVLTAAIMSPLITAFLTMWEYVDQFDREGKIWRTFIFIVPALAVGMFAFLLYLHLVLIILRWLIIPWNIRPGFYSSDTYTYHAKFLFDMLTRFSLLFSHPMYGAMITTWWLRAIGCSVGKNVECSNLFGFTPGLLKLDDGSFIADFVAMGPPEIFRGIMKLGKVHVEKRAFIGNGAVMHTGTKAYSHSLLGLMSVARGDIPRRATYIGSPAFRMERKPPGGGGGGRRKSVDASSGATKTHNTDEDALLKASEEETFNPTCWLVVRRTLWEVCRTVAPATCLSISFLISFLVSRLVITDLEGATDFVYVTLIFTWVGIVCNVLLLMIVKWIVVGTERQSANPLWSSEVWRGEFVVDCIIVLGGGGFMYVARGTPLIPWMFWLLGSKVGKDCFIDTVLFTEPSLVELGDNVCIGDRVTIQTHLFEDRVQKLGKLRIKSRATVGPLSVVLYSTVIGKGAVVGPLSLVMKGEDYPQGSEWVGIPAQRHAMASAGPNPSPTASPQVNTDILSESGQEIPGQDLMTFPAMDDCLMLEIASSAGARGSGDESNLGSPLVGSPQAVKSSLLNSKFNKSMRADLISGRKSVAFVPVSPAAAGAAGGGSVGIMPAAGMGSPATSVNMTMSPQRSMSIFQYDNDDTSLDELEAMMRAEAAARAKRDRKKQRGLSFSLLAAQETMNRRKSMLQPSAFEKMPDFDSDFDLSEESGGAGLLTSGMDGSLPAAANAEGVVVTAAQDDHALHQQHHRASILIPSGTSLRRGSAHFSASMTAAAGGGGGGDDRPPGLPNWGANNNPLTFAGRGGSEVRSNSLSSAASAGGVSGAAFEVKCVDLREWLLPEEAVNRTNSAAAPPGNNDGAPFGGNHTATPGRRGPSQQEYFKAAEASMIGRAAAAFAGSPTDTETSSQSQRDGGGGGASARLEPSAMRVSFSATDGAGAEDDAELSPIVGQRTCVPGEAHIPPPLSPAGSGVVDNRHKLGLAPSSEDGSGALPAGLSAPVPPDAARGGLGTAFAGALEMQDSSTAGGGGGDATRVPVDLNSTRTPSQLASDIHINRKQSTSVRERSGPKFDQDEYF